MDKQYALLLNSCAEDLHGIRSQLPSNLEPSIFALLDSVIERLEQCEEVVNDRAARRALIDDGLLLVARIVEMALVAAKIVDRFSK